MITRKPHLTVKKASLRGLFVLYLFGFSLFGQSIGDPHFSLFITDKSEIPIQDVYVLNLNKEIIGRSGANGIAKISKDFKNQKLVLHHLAYITDTILLRENTSEYVIKLEINTTLLESVDVSYTEENLKPHNFADFIPISDREVLLLYKKEILFYDVQSRRVYSKQENTKRFTHFTTDCNGNQYLSSSRIATRFIIKNDFVKTEESYSTEFFQEKIAPCALKISDDHLLIKRSSYQNYRVDYHIFKIREDTMFSLLSLFDTIAFENFMNYASEIAWLQQNTVAKAAAKSSMELNMANQLEEKHAFLKKIVHKPFRCWECADSQGRLNILDYTNVDFYVGGHPYLKKTTFLQQYIKQSDEFTPVGCINGNTLAIKQSWAECRLVEIDPSRKSIQKELLIPPPTSHSVKLFQNTIFFPVIKNRRLNIIAIKW